MNDLWQSEWESITDKYRQTKLFASIINTDISYRKFVFNLGTEKLHKLVEWMTGHGHFNYHLINMGVGEEILCRKCQCETETAYHVLLECESTEAIRFEQFGLFERDYVEKSKNFKATRKKWDTDFLRLDTMTIDFFANLIMKIAKFIDYDKKTNRIYD
jgi:hypothetical protein